MKNVGPSVQGRLLDPALYTHQHQHSRTRWSSSNLVANGRSGAVSVTLKAALRVRGKALNEVRIYQWNIWLESYYCAWHHPVIPDYLLYYSHGLSWVWVCDCHWDTFVYNHSPFGSISTLPHLTRRIHLNFEPRREQRSRGFLVIIN